MGCEEVGVMKYCDGWLKLTWGVQSREQMRDNVKETLLKGFYGGQLVTLNLYVGNMLQLVVLSGKTVSCQNNSKNNKH